MRELSSREETRRKLKCVLLTARSQPDKATYGVIPNVAFWKRQHFGDSEKTSGYQGLGGGKDKQTKHTGFLGQ